MLLRTIPYLIFGVCLFPVCRGTNSCIGRKTCGECISVGKHCVWCQDPTYDIENRERCNILSEHAQCPTEHLISPGSSLNRTKDDLPKDGSRTEPPIQIQPQLIHLTLRPKSSPLSRDPQRFNLTFRVARNYPVDLYYLMDLSNSMSDDKEKVAQLALQIDHQMKNLTDDLQMGFGSFVDKTVIPFVDRDRTSTCSSCVPAYGFKSHQPLTTDANLFKQAVTDARISASLDAPEGGMDAMMQAIVCEDAIGWRMRSRKMLLYASDATAHFAGDGKLGGIIIPNDGRCHLNNNGDYTQDKNQDYPSVSQLASKIVQNSINPIFAVTETQMEDYERLQKVIIGSVTGLLASDSSNVVDIIVEKYKKFNSRVEIISSGAQDMIIKYFSRCLKKDGPLVETNVCENLEVGDSVTFEIEIEAKECPEDRQSFSRRFYIKPVGLEDNVEIRLELACQCDCENEQSMLTNKHSALCNGHGTFVCGSCICDEKYFGMNCLCNTMNDSSSTETCQAPGDQRICSGRGVCLCGRCECSSSGNNRFTGRWCECDDSSCPFLNNALCGGPGHGVCHCGTCNCTDRFSGDNCDCSTATDACIDSTGELCGGTTKGVCECNKCKCVEGSMYRGPTCEDCMNCELVCSQHRDCVECVAHGTGKLMDNCNECLEKNYIEVRDSLPDDRGDYSSCQFKDENDCIFSFVYFYQDDSDLKIIAIKEKECPEEVKILPILLGVGLGVVALGIALLLIWKIVTTIQDRRELARFNLEKETAQWESGENPLFQRATTDHMNPTWRKSELN